MSDISVNRLASDNLPAEVLASVYVSPPFSPLGQWKGFDWDHLLRRCDSVMDYHDPSQRRYAANPYATEPDQQEQQEQQQQQQQQQRRQSEQQQSTQHYEGEQTPGQSASTSSLERFRYAAALQTTPTAASSTARGGNESHAYGFGQTPRYGAEATETQMMQYQAGLRVLQGQRPQDSSQYPQYGTNVLYSIGQSQAQEQASELAYDPVSQFRYRGSASTDPMAQQLGLPQTGQYYLAAGHAEPSAAPTSDFKFPQMPLQYQTTPAWSLSGPSTVQTQLSPMTLGPPPSASASYSNYLQPVHEATQVPSLTQEQAVQAFDGYKTEIRTIYLHVHNGSVRDAASLLLKVTRFLLENVDSLGLSVDDQNLHEDRVQVWDEFNNAWLVTLQAQFDLTQMIPSNPQTVLTVQELEQMAVELVSRCDRLERHGLVDYQMGVAEEEIMELLMKCIALLQPQRSEGQMPRAESSRAAASRNR